MAFITVAVDCWRHLGMAATTLEADLSVAILGHQCATSSAACLMLMQYFVTLNVRTPQSNNSFISSVLKASPGQCTAGAGLGLEVRNNAISCHQIFLFLSNVFAVRPLRLGIRAHFRVNNLLANLPYLLHSQIRRLDCARDLAVAPRRDGAAALRQYQEV